MPKLQKPASAQTKAGFHNQLSITVSFNEINEKLQFFFFRQTFVTEHKNFGLDFIKGLFAEVTDMDQCFVGESIHDIFDHEIARSFQSVICTDRKLDIITVCFAGFFCKSNADGHFGTDHFINGVKKTISFAEGTRVTVFPMTAQEIEAYVESGEPMDKAGAYAIQGLFAPYIKGIEGDYYNIVGFPIAGIYQKLKEEGILIR